MQTNKTALIRALNDRLRAEQSGGRIFLTQGVVARGPDFVLKTLTALKTYDRFDQGNDPYDEHDFGAVEIDHNRVFWKIDYYDLTLTQGAEDPSEPRTCCRVLTIMLSEEY